MSTSTSTRFMVALHWPTPRPVPKFGQFIWNPKYARLIWRDEIAETPGQLAELVNQAIPFVRDQQDNMLWIDVVPAPDRTGEADATSSQWPYSDIAAETDADKLKSMIVSLRQNLEEKQAVIDRITGGESEPEGQMIKDGKAEMEDAGGTPAATEAGKSTLSEKIASLPRKRGETPVAATTEEQQPSSIP